MKKILTKLIVISSFTALLGGLFAFAVIIYFTFSLPKIASLSDYKPSLSSKIISKDGVVLATIGKENRELANIEDIKQIIIDSFLSAEDAGFYEHTGVDYLGVVRALFANLRAGRVVQGGSTITQQVAKSLLLTRERSITRKIKDFLLAQKIEKRFTKREILYLYLNQVYLGGGYYGVKSAFRGYFDKDLSEATIAESALIAGLLVAPGKYSPYVNPKYAKKRQNYVLGRLFANGKITKDQYNEAVNEKIKYRLRKSQDFKAGYFTEWVRQRVVEQVGNDAFLNDGYKIVTTLNYELQKVAESEIIKGTKDIDKRQGFSGPLRSIGNEKIEEMAKSFRQDQYKEQSNYFVLNEELTREYEIHFDEEKYNEILEKKNEIRSKLYSSRYYPGNDEEDKLLSVIEKEKMYEAVVLSTDNAARIIYVNVGGLTGIIPYKYFRWAHERKITDERQYFSYVTSPSTIVKRGDVININIKHLKAKLSPNIWSNFTKKYNKSRDKKIIEEQTYLLCELDQKVKVQGALISLNPHTGEIVSMVGGNNFEESEFNRALQSQRQPGSSFKPLLFAAGLEHGYFPNTRILDTPEALGGADNSLNWKPRNYDGKFKGPMTFRNCLEQSRNIPTIKIALNLGMRKLHDFLDRIGFKAKIPNDMSIALGSFGATLLDMIKAYSVFPNGGKLVTPKFISSILDRDGREHYDVDDRDTEKEKIEVVENKINEVDVEVVKVEEVNPFHLSLNDEQVYDPRLAYIMTNILKGVVHHGTGKRAKAVSMFLGGKTGTTSNYIDAWFLGFSQNIVTAVWTGFDDNKTMGWGETGSKSALPIWNGYMSKSIKFYGESDFKMPLGIMNAYINKETGKASEQSEKGSFLESFVEGTEPGNTALKKFWKQDETSQSESGGMFEDDDFFNNQ